MPRTGCGRRGRLDAIHQKTADDLIRRVIALEARLTVDS